jgi:hypothetical protein
MATRNKTLNGVRKLESKPKSTSIGRSNNTKLSATSRNRRKKRYRGQG